MYARSLWKRMIEFSTDFSPEKSIAGVEGAEGEGGEARASDTLREGCAARKKEVQFTWTSSRSQTKPCSREGGSRGWEGARGW